MRAHTDERLIELMNKGQSEGLDELYRRYAAQLHAFCATTMSSTSPEDMVHEVFMRIIQSSSQFDASKGRLRTWLFQIARNCCVDASRREGRMQAIRHDDGRAVGPWGETVAADDECIEDSLTRVAIVKAVRDCIKQLTRDDERLALVLYYTADRVYREVGEMIGKSTSMAQKLVRQARQRMKHCLTSKGVTDW